MVKNLFGNNNSYTKKKCQGTRKCFHFASKLRERKFLNIVRVMETISLKYSWILFQHYAD